MINDANSDFNPVVTDKERSDGFFTESGIL